jgi:hypothetical protein
MLGLVKAVADLDGEKSELTGMDVWTRCNAFLLSVRLISKDPFPPPSLRLRGAPSIFIFISKIINRFETTPVQFLLPRERPVRCLLYPSVQYNPRCVVKSSPKASFEVAALSPTIPCEILSIFRVAFSMTVVSDSEVVEHYHSDRN